MPREQAIPELLDRHGGRLHALARRLCRGPEEAEDLVQEVFLTAWRKWDQFEGRSEPISWLYTIAARICRRMHRRRAGEPSSVTSLEDLLPFDRPTMPALDPEDVGGLEEQVRREARERVEAAIAELDPDFRLPLVLKEIAELPVAQVARILDLEVNTVKTRLHRARLKVRKAMEAALPQREGPPPAYERQVCLDLLQAKQEAMDRGEDLPDRIVCERCRAVFASLDLARELCREIGAGRLPEDLRRRILSEVA